MDYVGEYDVLSVCTLLFLLTNDGQKVRVCSRYSVPVFEVLGLHLPRVPRKNVEPWPIVLWARL